MLLPSPSFAKIPASAWQFVLGDLWVLPCVESIHSDICCRECLFLMWRTRFGLDNFRCSPSICGGAHISPCPVDTFFWSAHSSSNCWAAILSPSLCASFLLIFQFPVSSPRAAAYTSLCKVYTYVLVVLLGLLHQSFLELGQSFAF